MSVETIWQFILTGVAIVSVVVTLKQLQAKRELQQRITLLEEYNEILAN